MSKQYQTKFGEAKIDKAEMRNFCNRPGRVDENGKIQYTTEQHHKKECDVNQIIKKYDKTGLINHISKIEASYGDMSGLEYKEMIDKIAGAQSSFELLPAEIRKEFENNPEKLLEFMEHPENRDRAIELGLIDPQWTDETDGLGEHIKKDKNIKKSTTKPPPPETEKSPDSGEKT